MFLKRRVRIGAIGQSTYWIGATSDFDPEERRSSAREALRVLRFAVSSGKVSLQSVAALLPPASLPLSTPRMWSVLEVELRRGSLIVVESRQRLQPYRHERDPSPEDARPGDEQEPEQPSDTKRPWLRRVELGYLNYQPGQIVLLPRATHSPWSALIAAARHMAGASGDVPGLFFHQHADEHESVSELRAEAARAFIRDDRSQWVDLQAEHGCLQDAQQILAYLAQVKAWPTRVEQTDTADEQTKTAVLAFQRNYNSGYDDTIHEDGIVGRQTLAALFTVLKDDLTEWFGLNDADYAELYHLPASAYRGCGARFVGPRFDIGVGHNQPSLLDLLFVPPGEPLDPLAEPAGSGVYVDEARFENLPVTNIRVPRTHLLIIKLIDEFNGAPLAAVDYELIVGEDHRHGTTSSAGEVVEARLGDGLPIVRLLDGRLLVFHDRFADAVTRDHAPEGVDSPFSPADVDATEKDPIMNAEEWLEEVVDA